jgi:hypothetical protein
MYLQLNKVTGRFVSTAFNFNLKHFITKEQDNVEELNNLNQPYVCAIADEGDEIPTNTMTIN